MDDARPPAPTEFPLLAVAPLSALLWPSVTTSTSLEHARPSTAIAAEPTVNWRIPPPYRTAGSRVNLHEVLGLLGAPPARLADGVRHRARWYRERPWLKAPNRGTVTLGARACVLFNGLGVKCWGGNGGGQLGVGDTLPRGGACPAGEPTGPGGMGDGLPFLELGIE
ncbi:MAG: hypothetical protein FJ096_22710 [Deltaproteobacteria bacterium]|nr:hypothetical protein [Deltaproteobacteria bacterium]